MEEDKAAASSGGDPMARASSSFVRKGDRKIFAVELRPGETTIVSWKKLMKDANRVNGSASFPEHPVNANPSLESRIAPGQPTEEDAQDAPNRFSAVIEKIERLYTGRDSSDDEDLLDIPDDDQYDTEDSFIDDAELDEYFEVDNSAIKHDGFFVNRGKLERISEPPALPSQQPKKRRRKDILKDPGECFDGHGSNKDVKAAKTTGKAASLLVKNTYDSSQNLAVPSEHHEDLKFRNQMDASAIGTKKKAVDTRPILDPSVSLKVSSGDAFASVTEAKDVDKAKIGVFQSKNTSNKYKDSSGSFDSSQQKYDEKSAYAHSKSHLGRPTSNIDNLENPGQSKERNDMHELPDLNLSVGNSAMQATKSHYIHKKDGSSVRPRTSMLERAIRDLEKAVAESRPPAGENQEADTASLAVKRRLPREVKLKLAKVARLAASQGKVSKELIIRLMSILGHLIQVRTLKRNLKIMISTGLSAKKEKDDRFQQIKKEVVELIKMKPPSLEFEQQQQAGSSGDFQECGPEDQASTKRKYSMDTALEEKICDLYDLFVDGLDEDAGPQIRKLYAELATLWPNGHMDNHGIKRAICRAKERRKALYSRHKDQEKIKKRKMLGPWQEETFRIEASSVTSTQNMRERLASESSSHNFTSANKPVSNTVTAVQVPSPSMNSPKQEKIKGSSNDSLDGVRAADGILTKKKVKRKPEMDLEETHFHPEKPGEERPKSQKQSAGPSLKSSLQLTSISGLEQSS